MTTDQAFVTARIGAHRIAVEAASVIEVLPCDHDRAAATDLESVLGLARQQSGDRMRLHLRHAGGGAEIEVPGPDLQVGRRLRGLCHTPKLVAATLERYCLAGVIQDDQQLFYVLDVARFFDRYVECQSKKGDRS